ncbi:SemiSWEET transporter [Spongiivirga citrea]|uniref:Glutathione synthetase n=1 Tax=Spongiivirga citrea TaxID=1481457 RepID=A0A6M0CE65_9FLAO|nr:SemiSWEET transporter [Spongiivirga citrea]NER16105.1 glutathione synthetase [Spongiivirga citrea]
MTELIGQTAAVLTTCSFIPQAIKTIRTNDTSGISLWMYSMFCIGIVLWFVYGVLIDNAPMIYSNFITSIFAWIVLVYKIRNTISKK